MRSMTDLPGTGTSIPMLGGAALIILAVGCASGPYSGPYRGPVPPPVDLSGTWILNIEESDNANSILGEAQERLSGRGGEEGQMPGGGRGGGRGGGMRGGGGTMPDMETMRERMMQTLSIASQPAQRLLITQTDTSVAIVFPAGPGLVVIPDGREVEVDVEEGGDIDTKAEWRGSALTVEREVNQGGTIRQTLYRTEDGSRLILVTEVRMARGNRPAGMGGRMPAGGRGSGAGGGEREPITIRRAYDPLAG